MGEVVAVEGEWMMEEEGEAMELEGVEVVAEMRMVVVVVREYRVSVESRADRSLALRWSARV